MSINVQLHSCKDDVRTLDKVQAGHRKSPWIKSYMCLTANFVTTLFLILTTFRGMVLILCLVLIISQDVWTVCLVKLCCHHFLTISVLIADIFGPLLCGNQPLQEPTYLLWEHHRDVQGEEEAWDASTHLRHLWVSIPLHASRYDTLLSPHWPFAFLARVGKHKEEHFSPLD